MPSGPPYPIQFATCRLGLLASAAFVLACSAGARSPAGFAVDTVRGVVHARNDGAVSHWSLIPVVTVPADNAGLQRIASVLLGPSMELYVADEGASRIVVFDSAGRLERTMGREGSGPGEFVDLSSMAWLGDSLVVYDPRAGRVQVLSRRGEWVAEWHAARISGFRKWLQAAGGGFYAPSWRPEGREIRDLLVHYTADGPADTLVPPAGRNDPVTGLTCPFGRPEDGIAGLGIPFAPVRISAGTPTGDLVTAVGTDYRITNLDAMGDTLRIISVAADPIPISDAEWDDSLSEIRAFHQKYPGVRCVPEEPVRPDAKPAVREIVFDDHNRMWVEAQADSGLVFDVFDAVGHRHGRVPLPPRDPSVLPAIRRNRLALVTRGANGDQELRVYAIKPRDR